MKVLKINLYANITERYNIQNKLFHIHSFDIQRGLVEDCLGVCLGLPLRTPRQPPRNPLATPSQPWTDVYWFQHHKKVFLVLLRHCIYRFHNL